jgi:cytochrome P450
MQNLRNIVFDLFLAGSETTSSTLKWAVLFMAKHQDIQKKVQARNAPLLFALFTYLHLGKIGIEKNK